MLRLFGSKNPALDENITSYIFSFLDKSTRSAAASVNKDWASAIEAMRLREKLYHLIIIPSQVVANPLFYQFIMTPLTGGLTNATVKLTLNQKDYVARLPGQQTDQYINRAHECVNAALVSELNVNPTIYYYDAETGRQLSAFLPKPEAMTAQTIKNVDRLTQALIVLRHVHQSKTLFANDINLFTRNNELLTLIHDKSGTIDERYASLFQQMPSIQSLIESLHLQKVPCHNDANPGNFILSNGEMYLIDWEYGGNNYAIWDLICLANESFMTPSDINTMLETYFPDNIQYHTHVYHLLTPVYTLWAALWARLQLTNNNIVANRDDLIQLENTWLETCKKQLTSQAFTNAQDYFKSNANLVVSQHSPRLFKKKEKPIPLANDIMINNRNDHIQMQH